MIAALPATGLELTIQLTASPFARPDGSDFSVRVLAGPSGADPLPGGYAELTADAVEWRLVLQEFLHRITSIIDASLLPSLGEGTGEHPVLSRPTPYRSAALALESAAAFRSRARWGLQGSGVESGTAHGANGGSPVPLTRITVGELEIDVPGHRITRNGSPVTLTRQEFALLLVLLNRAGEVVLRDELHQELWHHDFPQTSRALDQCVFKLRRKLEPDPSAPRYLHCIRGVGYRFDPTPDGAPGDAPDER